MSTKSIKLERTVTVTEIEPLCEAFNDFFASLEGDCEPLEFENLKKVEVSIKKHSDGYKLKAKLTLSEPCENECPVPDDESAAPAQDEVECSDDEDNSEEVSCDGDEKKPSYKALKKRMDKDFDIIKKSVKLAELPPSDTVKRFMEDSNMMCRFQDKGEKYYEIYLAECDEFQKSFDAQNLEDIDVHIKRLKVLKKSCHKKYK